MQLLQQTGTVKQIDLPNILTNWIINEKDFKNIIDI